MGRIALFFHELHIDLAEQLACFGLVAFPDLRREAFAVQLHGIDTDVDKKLQSVRSADAVCVQRLCNHGDGAVRGLIDFSVGYDHRHAVSQRFGSKYLIRYFADRHGFSVCHRLDLVHRQVCRICCLFRRRLCLLLIGRIAQIRYVCGRICQNVFKFLTDARYVHADDDLHGLAVFGDAVSADAFEIRILFYRSRILDIDAQTGCAVGHVHDVVSAAQAFQDQRCQHGLFVHLLAAGLFCAELRFGIEFGLVGILASRRLEIKFHDQETEDHEPDTGVHKTDDQQQQQVLFPVRSHKRDEV